VILPGRTRNIWKVGSCYITCEDSERNRSSESRSDGQKGHNLEEQCHILPSLTLNDPWLPAALRRSASGSCQSKALLCHSTHSFVQESLLLFQVESICQKPCSFCARFTRSTSLCEIDCESSLLPRYVIPFVVTAVLTPWLLPSHVTVLCSINSSQ
jgi:hypothetical protein